MKRRSSTLTRPRADGGADDLRPRKDKSASPPPRLAVAFPKQRRDAPAMSVSDVAPEAEASVNTKRINAPPSGMKDSRIHRSLSR